MDIEVIYPVLKKRRFIGKKIRGFCFWIFLITAYCCTIFNVCFGGKAWSIIVLWSLWFVWTAFLTRPLVENNLINRIAGLLMNICILLLLIEVFLRSGWAGFVIPIVCFGMLVIIGTIFFLNVSKQKQNVMTMIWIISGSLVAFIGAFFGWPAMNWPVTVLGLTAFSMFVACVVVFPIQFFLELKKRFHT